MINPQFIKLIKEAARNLEISISLLSESSLIRLNKNSKTKFITGYTFPLNNSASYKIMRNKNLCSDVLILNRIPNVQHTLLFSPEVLFKRGLNKGNAETVKNFITQNGFPLIVKKNNSSNGEGVFLINNETELEKIISAIYITDKTFCLSPFREIVSEYRSIMLDNNCLLTYEKKIPFIVGDGNKRVLDLLLDFAKRYNSIVYEENKLFDESLTKRINTIPIKNEKIYLKWKHNSTIGSEYEIVESDLIKNIASQATLAIDAKFACVDIIYSKEYGYEVLEINASVVLNNFSAISEEYYSKAVDIYRLALNNLFIASK